MRMNLVIEHFVLIDLEILHQHLVMIHKELIFLAETLDQHFFGVEISSHCSAML